MIVTTMQSAMTALSERKGRRPPARPGAGVWSADFIAGSFYLGATLCTTSSMKDELWSGSYPGKQGRAGLSGVRTIPNWRGDVANSPRLSPMTGEPFMTIVGTRPWNVLALSRARTFPLGPDNGVTPPAALLAGGTGGSGWLMIGLLSRRCGAPNIVSVGGC